jgi:hypothetical protein
MYALGLYDFTNRSKQAEMLQNSASKKYGDGNLSTVAHSQGSINARKYGTKSKEIINVNSAFNPLDLRSYKRTQKSILSEVQMI